MPRINALHKKKRDGRRAVPLTSAPRHVPFGAVVATYFGGTLSTVGWSMLIISSVVTWMIPAHSELVVPLIFSGELAWTQGTVIGEQRIDWAAQERGRRHLGSHGVGAGYSITNPSMPKTALGFQYTVDGVLYEQVSFLQAIRTSTPQTGDVEHVQYVVRSPHIARIAGMQYYEHDWTVAWMLLFPLVALVLVTIKLAAAPSQIELLRDGLVTHGTLVQKRADHDGGFVALVFEFSPPPLEPAGPEKASPSGGGGSLKAKARDKAAAAKASAASSSVPSQVQYEPLTYRVEHIDVATGSVEDEEWEPILFLPRDPNIASMVDGLLVQLTPEGHWIAPKDWHYFLIGPVLFLAANYACARVY